MALKDVLKTASPEVLNEILREAESRLAAQLTTAIAADARAMTFLGFVATLAVASLGASLAVVASNGWLACIGIVVGGAFTAAGMFAFEAAKPIDFQAPGNDPSLWEADILASISAHNAIAEQTAHYDEMLKENRAAMEASARSLTVAAEITRWTVVGGAVASACYLAAKHFAFIV
ncbi:hypothetical protein [Rhizobium phaseoli]|uniref:hypothetical protein n=1 Tax=Rhizobium phaseoli TaxID=396 RepID=UPI0025540D5F|nr:hypothetical protein [Rhizobium phaseoli]MDK4730349.1 hypothetical protein [Rhizobium phaseoli]